MLDRVLIQKLADAGLTIQPHDTRPHEWYAGIDGGSDAGPYDSAEAALIGGVKWLVSHYRDARDEADETWKALRAFQQEVREL